MLSFSPPDHFGTYLDNNNKTIDEELELQNFEYAANVLVELSSKMVIDGHSIAAELVREKPTNLTINKSK